MLYLKKLKTTLQCNVWLIFILLVTFIYCFYNVNRSVQLQEKDNYEWIGKIYKITRDDKKMTLEMNGEGKILANYYFNDTTNSVIDTLKLGDTVKVIGNLKIPTKNTNFHLFNYRNYLLSKEINYILTIEDIEIVKQDHSLFYQIKNKLYEKVENSGVSAYLKAFVLGSTDEIKEDVLKSYQTNGISHLFSVSGMHIGFLSSAILNFLKWFCKNESINQIILFCFLLFYAFITGFSPSVLRSVIFVILLFIKDKASIPISSFLLYIVMTCGFLIYNPYYIYHTGFLYSFVISGFLIYYSSFLKGKNYFVSLVKISVIAFLASFPISMLTNFELNFLSLAFNLLFVPLVSFIIFPFSFLVFIIPILEPFYLLLTQLLEKTSLMLSKINNLTFVFAKPHLVLILLYYTISILIFKNWKKKIYWILLMIVLLIHHHVRFFLKDPVITMIDVGQGDSILIDRPFNQGNILIDTGGNSYSPSSLATSTIIPYLKSVGMEKIEYLILTHGDYDHMGEAINLVNNFKVEKVIFNCGEFNDLEKDLIKVLDKKKIPYYSCIKELNIDDNKLYFLNNGDYGNENNNSSVIYTELKGHKFLFMGDAGVDVEEDLIEKYNLQGIDILKVGHHGSKTSSGKKFIDEINPEYSIISVGKNNRYGHPNDSVLDNLQDSKVYRTDQYGSVVFKIKKNKLETETCTP